MIDSFLAEEKHISARSGVSKVSQNCFAKKHFGISR